MTSVKICNLALARIGAGRISSLDETSSAEAYQCNLHYDVARTQVLTAGRWKFAEEVVEASELASPPVEGWSYSYLKPLDALKVEALYPEGSTIGEAGVEFLEQGRVLYTKTPVENILYRKDVEDPSLFSPEFVRSFVLCLAYFLTVVLTGRYSQKPAVYKEYVISLREGLGSDMSEQQSAGEQGFDDIANVWGGTRE